MRHFASIQEIMEADVSALASLPEISEKQAQEIWNYFHGGT